MTVMLLCIEFTMLIWIAACNTILISNIGAIPTYAIYGMHGFVIAATMITHIQARAPSQKEALIKG